MGEHETAHPCKGLFFLDASLRHDAFRQKFFHPCLGSIPFGTVNIAREAGSRTLRRKLPILSAHVALGCLSDYSRCLSQPSLMPGNLQPRHARSAATCCKQSYSGMRQQSE